MPNSLTQIAKKIDAAMLADRHRLGQLLRGLRHAEKQNRPTAEHLKRLEDRLNASVALHELRKKHCPMPTIVDDLPIAARAKEIQATVAANRVVVIAGETGSGKSTQLPKMMLAMGRGRAGVIGHTQPRRLAARSVASRIAEEIGSPLGHDVGYKVRFGDKTNPQTYIKLMTDGVLLAEASRDRFFDAYDTIIIDEAHERSLNIDFLLGHLKQILPRRPDLRLIITSATIDTQRFAEHFPDAQGRPAPVIEVSGRTYPVEVRYRAPVDEEESGGRDDGIDALLSATDELMRERLPATTSGAGGSDMLVFMPTERDIREACDALEQRYSRGWEQGQRRVEVLPLFARLTQQEQDRIFKRGSAGRRIIIATNVAESSLTVPGIGYVIDTGTARVSRYAPNSKVQRLPIERISQASANQRMGRCGRLGPGICIRLFSEEDFRGRDEFSTPEVQRTSLASVILRITALGFGAIEDFPFVESPRPSMIRDGYKTLEELGAISFDTKTRGVGLTKIGRQLSRMPVDPRVARIVLAGAEEGCLDEVMVIAAAMEVADPRDRPMDKKGAADQAHALFADERSDFFAYVKLWEFYHTQREKLSHNQLRKACKKNFLSYMRMREWVDVHRQLVRLVKEAGLKHGNATVSKRPDNDELIDDAKGDAIHRALLTGLLSNIACKGEGFEYNGAGGLTLNLWPGSALFRDKPQWVVAAELVETTRRYARTVGKIQPGMIEPIAGHLMKKTHSAPRWVAGSGSVMCDEKVSLYGLTIVARRAVPFCSVDTKIAREMFIMHGLVEGDWECSALFFKHNANQVEVVRDLEAKSRRSGLLCGEDKRYAFYDARLPAEVYDAARLNKWRKSTERENPKVLFMSHADLMTHDASDVTPAAYPEALPSGQKLDYRFELGAKDDGVTLTLAREKLGKLDARQVGWLVPGLLERKVEALIKSLPRTLRRPLSPAPDAARKAAQAIDFGNGVFEEAAAEALSKLAGLRIRVDDFKQGELPDHLRMNLRVVDEHGKEVGVGRDLAAIRKSLGAATSPTQRFLAMEDATWNAPGATSWAFGELPTVVEIARAGEMVKACPALVDLRESVALRLVEDRGAARRLTWLGLRRLYMLEAQRELRWRVDHWLNIDELRLWYSPFGGPRDLRDELVGLLVERAFLYDKPKLTTRESFITRQHAGHQRLDTAEAEVRRVVSSVLQSVQASRLSLDRCLLPKDHYARADLRVQMKNLLGAEFLLRTPWNRLASLPRYLGAVSRRIEKLGNGKTVGANSDLAGFRLVAPHWNNYALAATRLRELGEVDAELEEYRWLIEELRVSLFAQEIGTSQKVSPQRLEKQWAKVRR